MLTLTAFYDKCTLVATRISYRLYRHAMFDWKKLRASL
jgi:hypothetical protein